MKKWSLLLSFALLSSSLPVFAQDNSKADVSSQTEISTEVQTDTLAKRHPALATALVLASRHYYQKSLTTTAMPSKRHQGSLSPAHMQRPKGELVAERNSIIGFNEKLAEMFDFSLALVGPSALGDDSAAGQAATILIAASVKTHSSQARTVNPGSLNPAIYSAALSHALNPVHSEAKNYIESAYANQTDLVAHSNSLATLAPAAMFAVASTGFYLGTGGFTGFLGNMAQGAAYKVGYVLFDGVEKYNLEKLKEQLGEDVAVEAVAQFSTGVLLSVTSTTLERLNYGLSGTVAYLAAEVSGYEYAASGFGFIEHASPEYAPYINPALATGMLAMLAPLSVRTKLAKLPANAQGTIAGASFAAFLQLTSTALSLPGWLEDEAYKMAGNAYSSLASKISDTYSSLTSEVAREPNSEL